MSRPPSGCTVSRLASKISRHRPASPSSVRASPISVSPGATDDGPRGDGRGRCGSRRRGDGGPAVTGAVGRRRGAGRRRTCSARPVRASGHEHEDRRDEALGEQPGAGRAGGGSSARDRTRRRRCRRNRRRSSSWDAHLGDDGDHEAHPHEPRRARPGRRRRSADLVAEATRVPARPRVADEQHEQRSGTPTTRATSATAAASGAPTPPDHGAAPVVTPVERRRRRRRRRPVRAPGRIR